MWIGLSPIRVVLFAPALQCDEMIMLTLVDWFAGAARPYAGQVDIFAVGFGLPAVRAVHFLASVGIVRRAEPDAQADRMRAPAQAEAVEASDGLVG